MRSHQRYFAVEDGNGQLMPTFLVVADGIWKDPARVIAGNERVLRARLADARFYWDVDRRTGLEGMARALDRIVWLEAVGTLAARAKRVANLVDRLGRAWYPAEWPELGAVAERAARLAKADLASEMIKDGKEFTGLQGVIGARYGEATGESPVLNRALIEQYLPRGAGDPLPASPVGTALAFADRLDTVAGCWSAGFVPSGSQDPYGLRRAANGMIRILLEKSLHLSLAGLVDAALAPLPGNLRREGLAGEILAFLADRTAYFLRERDFRYDVVDAVLGADADDPVDALIRAEALQALREDEALERLVVGFKRAANILKGVDVDALPDPAGIDWSTAEPADRTLREASRSVGKALDGLRQTKDYRAMLRELLTLREPIDVFFDEVLVMSPDAAVRDRRLSLLAGARELFADCFDPARIVIEGETEARTVA
jgi:glycyl-tRNA synthetase beta chain